jgi:hypothetical protein
MGGKMKDQKKIMVQDLGKMTMKEVHDLCENHFGCKGCPFLSQIGHDCIITTYSPAGWPIWEDDE